jgi:hypothetical protein
VTDNHALTRRSERPGTPTGLAASVAGLGLFRLSPGDLASARKRPGTVPEAWAKVPASLLRSSDEQTVAGVAATFEAIAGMGRSPEDFSDWGVVSASRFLGRAYLATVLRSFAAEGVWGVSPHLIPHFALHSPSGTISLALGSHGPNLGVGGGRNAEFEGFLTALTWISTGSVPGVWLVLSGWEPELVPGQAAGECLALALALTSVDQRRPQFRIVSGPSRPVAGPPDLAFWSAHMTRVGARTPLTNTSDSSGNFRVEWVSPEPEPGGHDA